MKRRLIQLATALLTAVILCGVAPADASAQPLDAAQKSYRDSANKRAALIGQLESLEKRYNGLVRRIEERKRAGAMETFAGRLELGNLLRESKALADELASLQERVRRLDDELDSQRTRVLGRIDAEVSKLERQLGSADRTERRRLVSELNALRRQRADYSAPLPDAPSLAEIRDALSLAEEVDPSQPEELLAAADELQDTEDQIRRRLTALRERLDSLERRKRLMRRADNLSREERFFEETDRNRVIARVEKGQGSSGSESEQPNRNSDDGFTGAPTADESGNNAAPTSGDDLAAGGDVDFEGAADPSPSRERSGGFTDAPDSPSQAPEQGGSAGDDPFASSGETVVISAGAEPTRAVSGEATRVRDVDAAIDDLEEEERELSKQADALESRAKDLRKKANDFD